MIHYKDMTFCASPACKNKCGRQLTEKIEADAERWWGKPGAPISMAYFCDEEGEPYCDSAARGEARKEGAGTSEQGGTPDA